MYVLQYEQIYFSSLQFLHQSDILCEIFVIVTICSLTFPHFYVFLLLLLLLSFLL